jgi:hypothetical protein
MLQASRPSIRKAKVQPAEQPEEKAADQPGEQPAGQPES